MCGISLLVDCSLRSSTQKLTIEIQNMMIRQNHRGPDQNSYWVNAKEGIAIGHNRLSIVDKTSNGIQPMMTEDCGIIISFNGEIFNYKDLQQELKRLGVDFNTKTDTEVILKGYNIWGKNIFKKLNGMFGLCIYDRRNSTILIGRDRVGMKPVYYTKTSSHFIVASEIKAILASGAIKPKVCPHGINEYFTFQNIFSDRTLFKDIFMLEPGHILEYNINKTDFIIHQYWDLEFNIDKNFNELDYTAKLKETFLKAAERITIGDVPIGASLSGGMDSSSIVATLAHLIPNLNTFTGYFDQTTIVPNDRSINENIDAKLVSQKYNTIHHERLIHPTNVIDTLPSIVWHLEDPKVGMCYTFYLLSQLISQYVTVNISGTGGDEIFGGYPWRYGLISNGINSNQFDEIYYSYWNRLIPDADKNLFFQPNLIKEIDIQDPRHQFKKIISKAPESTNLNRAIYFEFKTFLHGMLMVEDKMGMAFSIETRFPFLDNEMIDIASRIPDNYKFYANEAKILLKKSFEKILPESIINKPKQGFTPPDRSWYRNDLKHYIDELLLGHRSLIGEYINREYISKVLSDHNSMRKDNRLLIWSLMFFEGWLRTFISNESFSETHF